MERQSLLRFPKAFTILELLTVIVVLIVLAGLFLPTVRTSREAARRMQCSNNLKQLQLAVLEYESAHRRLPNCTGGTGRASSDKLGNANRLSGFVTLLPFLGELAIWEQVDSELEVNGTVYPPMGPAPWVADYPPWKNSFRTMICPSNESIHSSSCSYAFSIADAVRNIYAIPKPRGAFAPSHYVRLSNIPDGTRNTLSILEIGLDHGRQIVGHAAILDPPSFLDKPSLCLSSSSKNVYSSDIILLEHGRGSRWADGAAIFTLANSILPPNAPSCASSPAEDADGIYTSGSHHTGGANVAMLDGSVQFISESIDTGDLNNPVPVGSLENTSIPSPFGVWGALGTAQGMESLADR